MTLAAFIHDKKPEIIKEWEAFARSLLPAATEATPLALRNHINEILAFIIVDIGTPQTSAEQVKKSQGGMQKEGGGKHPSAAETHAALRLAGGFNLDQMVSEYRALRASILKLWMKAEKEANKPLGDAELEEMTRFNEAIDQSLTESVRHYAKMLGESKDLFLGILTHDLRNPLGAMLGAADLVPRIGPLNDRQTVLMSQIVDSGARINEIISHLLDITKARFGSGLPVMRAPMDMGFVARQLVDEARVMHPDRKFELEISGEMRGDWDKARIAQVFSNLLGNAVQYSFTETPIEVNVTGDADSVVVSVHNIGLPVPPGKIATIFDSLVRATDKDDKRHTRATTNLGLGLFITREIVTGHNGKITVVSTEKDGTTFTASFPRKGKYLPEAGEVDAWPSKSDAA